MHRKLAEYSKLAFRQTLASKEGQGRDRASERAAKELRTAVDFEPGDSTMKKELGILEGEVGVKCERDLTLSMEGLAMWIRRL